LADVEGIKVANYALKDRGLYYSEKYSIPIVHNNLKVPYLMLDSIPKLCYQTNCLENSFNKGKFRTRISNFQSESLIKKAIGYSENKQQTILDITGGLGHDAFIMALLGEKITLIEKNIGLCVLIEEALENLPPEPYFSKAKSNITVINSDSRKFAQKVDQFDVIFADPMFNSQKKLKRTKQMEFLDLYLEEHDDPSVDFYETEFKRMVVKKDLRSLSGIMEDPAISFKGRSVKFDVYFGGAL